MPHEAPPPAADLHRVLDDELDYIRQNRHPGADPDTVRRTFVGLAMSGGGIRSATTNLGMLQALAKMRILPMVDYLSTVSGGGYIGACMSALCSWNHNAAPTSANPRAAFTFFADEKPAFSTEPERFPFHPDHSAHSKDIPPRDQRIEEARGREPGSFELPPPHPRASNGIIAHLRTHGNFLIAHRGLFRREALRGIGALTIGGLYNALGFLLILVSASALYLTIILALTPELPRILSTNAAPAIAPDTSRHALIPTDSAVTRTRTTNEVCQPADAGCVSETKTTFHAASMWDRVKRNANAAVMVFKDPQSVSGPHRGSFLDSVPGFATSLAPILLAVVLGIISTIVIMIGMTSTLAEYVRGRFAPSIRVAGDSVEDRFERHVLRRSTTGLLIITVFAVLFGKFLWETAFKPEDRIIWLFVPVAALSGAWIVSFLVSTALLPWMDNWTRRFRSLSSAFYAITSWGWGITLAFALAPILIFALRSPTGLGLGAIGSLILSRLLSGRTSGSKRFSLSPGALRIVLGIVVMLVMAFGVLLFATLLTMYFDTWLETAWVAAIGSAIIIAFGWLANHNKLGPQYFYRDRLSETYLFSELPDEDGKLRVFHDAMEMPLDCLHGQPNKPDSGWKNPAPYHIINAAINLAGSRDLTRKDRKSGYWLFSKLYCGSTHTGFRKTSQYRGGATKLANAISISGAAASSGIGKDTFFAQAFATVLFNIRLGAWLENPAHASSISGREVPVFWPRYLVREALMATTESGPRVNLSDGGHTGDNIGLYPLLQRRCKVIIVCDAERDPALTFGSFTEAMRQAYIDMGVDVDIDLTMIRPNPDTGLSRSHCAVGRIHYPDRPDQESTLIYIKNSLMGDEPEPVLNYKIKCNDFPHESTVDQFFDDAQFESYRALGVHITEHTFGRWTRTSEFETARAQHAHAGA